MEQDQNLMSLMYRVRKELDSIGMGSKASISSTNYTEDEQGVYAEMGNRVEFIPVGFADEQIRDRISLLKQFS